LPPTDAELRTYYDKTRSDYTNDGTMIVHDLVMHVGGFQNANQSTPQAISDAADAVYRLRSGASVDYAKEHYGFVDSNRLPAVEELDFVVKMRLGDKLFEVASALGSGEISDPVIDDDGVHVLVMDVRRPASVADFTAVRDKVYQAYRRAQGERATAENVKLLRSQAQILLAPGQEE
jgi:parvulin-like peptidyl-prolyl isomerase